MDSNIRKPISREEIRKAMENYLKEGGKIKVLPPEQHFSHSVIGGSHLGYYEDIETFVFSD
ncbi:MAG: hypothetical protein HQM13_20365 [SAR324 cluster bacterium]|nr:hypothetical protein [SAR324 cluster bacterium]